MYASKALLLAIVPLVAAFATDDAPAQCKAICAPLGRLGDLCDVELANDNEVDEQRLQSQCVCTNKSFDVAKVAALCADCMHQSRTVKRAEDDRRADADDLRDIDKLMATCAFASAKYAPSATSVVSAITVSASKLTAISQLTPLPTARTNTTSRAATTSAASRSGSAGITSPARTTGATATGNRTTAIPTSVRGSAGRNTAGNALYIAGAFGAAIVGGMLLQ